VSRRKKRTREGRSVPFADPKTSHGSAAGRGEILLERTELNGSHCKHRFGAVALPRRSSDERLVLYDETVATRGHDGRPIAVQHHEEWFTARKAVRWNVLEVLRH